MATKAGAPRGILKNAAGGACSGDGSGKKMQWDEEKVAETEAMRGGKMKIDEPKTPFAYEHEHALDDDNDDDDNGSDNAAAAAAATAAAAPPHRELTDGERVRAQLDQDALARQLAKAAAVREREERGLPPADVDEDEEAERERRKREAFERKRREHYNEFQMKKQLAAQAVLAGDEL